MKWFRMYYEARNDKKLALLSDAQHRTWFWLLCFAAEQEGHRGVIQGYTDKLLAVEVCGGDVDLLNATLAILDEYRITERNAEGITFIAFRKRQYDKPSDEPEAIAERVIRHRNAKCVSRNDLSTFETLVKRDVTPLQRAITREVNTDSDTESDSETEDPVVIPASGSQSEDHVPSKIAAPNGAFPHAPVSKKNREPKGDHQQIWQAFLDAGCEKPATSAESTKWGKAISELLKAGETAASISPLIERFQSWGGDFACNPYVIARNLSELRREPRPKTNGRAPPEREGPHYLTMDESREKQRREEEEGQRYVWKPHA